MTRLIISSLAVAAVLSLAAGSDAVGEDFMVWRKTLGTTAGKAGEGAIGANQTETIGAARSTTAKRKGVTDPKETITIHGSPGVASKHKGE